MTAAKLFLVMECPVHSGPNATIPGVIPSTTQTAPRHLHVGSPQCSGGPKRWGKYPAQRFSRSLMAMGMSVKLDWSVQDHRLPPSFFSGALITKESVFFSSANEGI